MLCKGEQFRNSIPRYDMIRHRFCRVYEQSVAGELRACIVKFNSQIVFYATIDPGRIMIEYKQKRGNGTGK